jgi:hypothetical protein
MLDRRRDDGAHLRFVDRCDDDVGDARDAAARDKPVDLADGELAVAVRQARERIGGSALRRQQVIERRHQRRVEPRRWH